MWQAMSPPSSGMLPPHLPQSTTTSTGAPNADGSSNVYVHHISHGPAAPPSQPQQPAYVPYPMPMPAPQPTYMPYPYPPPPPSYGCPYNHHQQQPAVVVLQKEPKKEDPPPKDKPKEKKAETPKPAPAAAPAPKEEPKEDPKPKGPRKFSKFSVVSVIICFLALIFGTVCIVKTYAADDARIEAKSAGQNQFDSDAYTTARTVALGMGAVSTLCFTIATLCSFYAGLRHKMKSGAKHCCLDGLLISGWVIFCLTFITNLIILVLAFDEENIIYPEVVLVGFMGSLLSWILMFGYSEMARRG